MLDERLIIPAEEYHKWLNDPVTRAVFALGEAHSRPAVLGVSVPNESDASFRLGVITGRWAVLDELRSFDFVSQESLEPTYEVPEETD